MTPAWPWVALAGLGAFHGLNPAMGWLLAVGLGLQRRSRSAVLRALLPIALGHALSIALVVAAVGLLRSLIDFTALQLGSAVVIIGFGVYRLLVRHRAGAAAQVGSGQLALWSFLMATAHGAGLMLVPVLLRLPIGAGPHDHAHLAAAGSLGGSAATGLAAVGIHTLAMLAVAGAVALAVYQWLGAAFLRRARIDLDLLWALALIAVGLASVVQALA